MKLSDVVIEYRGKHGLSQRAFAKQCGISHAYIAILEKGENPATGRPITPTIPQLKAIASGMGMTLEALLTISDDIEIDISDRPFPLNLAPMPRTNKAPRLGSIACGEPILAEQNIEEYDDVPDYVKCDFTLLCKGDSMTGARIYDGDIVCIKQQEEAQNGQIAAVLVDGEFETEATLKRVRLLKDGIALWPENPIYEPWIFTGEDANRVHIIGIATHFISVVK